MALQPLLFVAMPFGRKLDPSARVEIDFDRVYEVAIAPAARAANLDVIRADEEIEGGLIHVGMFERLLLAEIVVADLSALNANVFYELGIRHAARPRTTIPIFARMTRLPFDLAPIRAIPYDLEEGRLTDAAADELREALVVRLVRARDSSEGHDSPLFQLLRDYRGIELAHEVTESFRERVIYITEIRERIKGIAGDKDSLDQLTSIRDELMPFDVAPVELLVDLLLAYRSVGEWDALIGFVEELPKQVRDHITVREQLAQALGRRNKGTDRSRAVGVLQRLIEERGPSAETSGILGGIRKRQWQTALKEGHDAEAEAALDAAIDAYADGFDADPRDAYPGINLMTLLTCRGRAGDLERVSDLGKVVAFALSRRGIDRSTDYWDRATMLELAILMGDREAARRSFGALALTDAEGWMFETTADNLAMLADAYSLRDEKPPEGLLDVIVELRSKAV